MYKIITIGREFGSGGRELGRRLSEKLQIAYYDQEIVTEISKDRLYRGLCSADYRAPSYHAVSYPYRA